MNNNIRNSYNIPYNINNANNDNNVNNNFHNNNHNNVNNNNHNNNHQNNSNNNSIIENENFYDNLDENENNNNLSEFERKKRQLILEMDEYQYKHIIKYNSRKETECSICLGEFIGTDIIKAFNKCEHIFHKKCLLDWLKNHNYCPLCKHDLEDDINQN